MKLTLYLMTQKGFEVLTALVHNNFKNLISEVIVGRDAHLKNDYADEMIWFCKKNNILIYEKKQVPTITSNYSLAVSWRWLIDNDLSKLIVLHDSLLPKYRGFSPLVNMLINTEKEIGVSAIFASKEYDTGAIIAQSSTHIQFPITIGEAIDLIKNNYIELALKIFGKLQNGKKIDAYPQDEKLATYSLWRNEDDYQIDWNNSAEYILNFINALSNPYKGAFTFMKGSVKIRVLEAMIESDAQIENRDVGKVIFNKNNYPVIVCKSGLIKLLKVVDDITEEDVLPFKNFRVRLTNSST